MSRISSKLRVSLENRDAMTDALFNTIVEDFGGPKKIETKLVTESDLGLTALDEKDVFVQVQQELDRNQQAVVLLEELELITKNIEEDGEIDEQVVAMQRGLLNQAKGLLGGEPTEVVSVESFLEAQAEFYRLSLEAKETKEGTWSKIVDMIKRWATAFYNWITGKTKDTKKKQKEAIGAIDSVEVKERTATPKEKEDLKDLGDSVAKLDSMLDAAQNLLQKQYSEKLKELKQLESQLQEGETLTPEQQSKVLEEMVLLGKNLRDKVRIEDVKLVTIEDIDAFFLGESNPFTSKLRPVLKRPLVGPAIIKDADKPFSKNESVARLKLNVDQEMAKFVKILTDEYAKECDRVNKMATKYSQ